MENYTKYKPYPPIALPDRQWPARIQTRAPIWCSVDLRDGNQALEIPMNLEQKLRFFRQLTDMGFKTIEIGFPAASDTEYAFTRYLIDHNLIPEDVTIQVLTQSRQHRTNVRSPAGLPERCRPFVQFHLSFTARSCFPHEPGAMYRTGGFRRHDDP